MIKKMNYEKLDREALLKLVKEKSCCGCGCFYSKEDDNITCEMCNNSYCFNSVCKKNGYIVYCRGDKCECDGDGPLMCLSCCEQYKSNSHVRHVLCYYDNNKKLKHKHRKKRSV